jgi:hypothetical protein
MSRAVCSLAEGDYLPLQKMAVRGIVEFAVKYGYIPQLYDPSVVRRGAAVTPWNDGDRPASWLKLVLMHHLLLAFDEVLWLDADVFVRDVSRDPAQGIPTAASMALAMHKTDQGWVPNCGVWLVRRKARGLLLELWQMDKHRDGGWWEQSALIERLGMYRDGGKLVAGSYPNELFRSVYWLDGGYNAVPGRRDWWDHRGGGRSRFLHATGMPLAERLAHFKRWEAGGE